MKHPKQCTPKTSPRLKIPICEQRQGNDRDCPPEHLDVGFATDFEFLSARLRETSILFFSCNLSTRVAVESYYNFLNLKSPPVYGYRVSSHGIT